MRNCLVVCTSAALSACGSDQVTLESQARSWLSNTYGETSIDTLNVRRVRRVNDAVCGEAGIGADEHHLEYRLFYFRSGKEGAFDLPGPRMRLPGGVQCPVRDEILAVCAATAEEREAAKRRATRCMMKAPI
jgi:hypothetical protein